MGTIFKTFVSAARQYLNNKTEENMELVLNQFDVLMGQTSSATDLQFFDPRDVQIAESLIKMVDLLLDMKPQIVQKLFFLLGNLGHCPRLQESLCRQLQLHSSLALFLQMYGASTKDTLVIQCLKLLKVYTYHAVLNAVDGPVEYLLQVILKEVQTSFSETLIPCLGILSNLCTNSPAVVSYIRSLPNFTKVMTDLLEKLSCTLQPVLLYSMISLYALTRGDAVGHVVFNERNVCRAVEVLIRVFNTDELSAHRAATSLLSALLTTPEYQAHIEQCNQLDNVLQTTWKALRNTKMPVLTSNIQRLLISVFSVHNLRSQALNALLILSEEEITQILAMISDWATSYENNLLLHKVDIMAWQLLLTIFQELHEHQKGKNYLNLVVSAVKTAFPECLQAINFESPDLKFQLEKISKVLEFVHLISELNETHLSLHMEPEWLESIVKGQTDNYTAIGDQDCREASINVVLLTVSIMSSMVSTSVEMQDAFLGTVKNNNILPFLAASLLSSDPLNVQRVMDIISCFGQFHAFPTYRLGEVLASLNKLKNCSATNIDSTYITLSPKPSRTSAVKQQEQSMDSNVELLISKLENGLEIRDLECSDIMEMYENKVNVLQHQCQELQELLEAKSCALQKCDKVFNHYRCLQTQHDAQVLKLRKLVQESEKKSELAREQSRNLITETETLQSELQVSQLTIASLQKEREELTESNVEGNQRIKSAQLQIEELQKKAENLREINTVLQRQNDNFQLKEDALNEEVKNLSAENRGLTKQLKDKDNKVKDLTTSLEKCKKDLDAKNQALDSARKSNEDLKEDFLNLEKKNSDLKLEVSSLHKLCAQHQNTLLEKSEELQILNEKYSEQKKLTTQIMALCKQES